MAAQSDVLAPAAPATVTASTVTGGAHVGGHRPATGGGPSLRTQAIRASAWTLVGYGATQVLRLGSNLVLTRLLVPEVFGLMGLVMVLIQGLQMFSDVGIGPAIVQSRRGEDPRFLNTAWTIQVMRGFALFLTACVLTWPAAAIYGRHELRWLIPAAAATAILQGFGSTALYTLSREMKLAAVTTQQFASQVVSTAVTVVWAAYSPTVWALVAGAWAGAMMKTALSHRLPGVRNWFKWDREAAESLFRFGRWIFLSTALTFLSSQLDRLLFGRMLGMETLGIYMVAFTLYSVPRDLLGRLGSTVIFPGIAKLQHLPRAELRLKLLKSRWPVLVGMAALNGVMIGAGDLVVRALYTGRYEQASWMLVVLSVGLWSRVLNQTLAPSLMSIGQVHYNPIGSVCKLALVAAGLPVAYAWYGLPGAIAVVAAGDIPNYVTDAVGLWRNRLSALRQDLCATLILLGVVGLILLVRWWAAV